MFDQLHKVKKIALISILIFGFFFKNANAQSSYYNNEYSVMTAGLIAGATFMQVDGDGYKGYHKTGFTGGGILYLPFGDVDLPFDATVALSMEVLYTQKGARGKGPILNTYFYDQNIQLHYGEVPIQINIYRGARKSGFGAGFSVGYLGLSEETIKEQGQVELKQGKPFRKFDFCFVLTGNLHVWNGFFLSPRFEYSLVSVRKNNSMFGGRNEQFNNVLALRLMYLIRNKS